MTVNTKNLVSITEANQNFSRVARLVDENGAAVILNFIKTPDPWPAFRADSRIWRHRRDS